MMGNLLTRTIHEEMSITQSMVERMQKQDEERLLRYAYLLTNTPRLVDATYAADVQGLKEILEMSWHQLGLDAIAVTDANGIVLARGRFDLSGDDLSWRPDISAALKGKAVAGMIFQETALVPYCIRVHTPIFKDGVVAGVLLLGADISTEAYVDNLRQISGMHFTLIKDGVNLVTSLKDDDGNRVTDIKHVDAQVTDAVMGKGETVIARGKTLGHPSMTAYWPITDIYGENIGMWAITKSLEQQQAETNRVLVTVIFCSLGIMLLIALMAGLQGNRVALSIRKVVDYAAQVAYGDLDASLSMHGRDELGVLANALRVMVTTLKERILQSELHLAKLRLMANTERVGLWEVKIVRDDPVNLANTIEWSDEFRRLLGYTDKNDFPNILSSWTDCIHPDDKGGVVNAFAKHIMDATGKTPYDVEYRMKRKNGEWAYCRDIGETIRDENGSALYVAGALIDVTETKKMLFNNELKLIELNQTVKVTKASLWNMEVMQNDLVNGDTITWAEQFKRLLGFPDGSEFPNNLPHSFYDRLHPEDSGRVIDVVVSHLLDKTGKTPFDVEYRLLKENGEYGYYIASGETIRDTDGTPIHIAGSLVDVTEMKNLIHEAEKQRIAAEEANKAKSAFLSAVSHEIRTPMNVIQGLTECLLQREILDTEVIEALGMMYTSGDLLLNIINDILDLSKIEAGRLELHVDNYDITHVINDTVRLNIARLNIAQAGSKQITFELNVDEGMPATLLGDELRIKQILNNLLSNAFKYTLEGMVKLSASAEVSENNDGKVTLVLSVSDTGQGMTAEQVEKLFAGYHRFNQESNRAIEGTGLGMNISRNLLRMMDGKIFVESEPGKGSTFTVRIPQGKVDSGTLGKERVANLRQFHIHSDAWQKKLQIQQEPMPYGNVLIVDDVDSNTYVAKSFLALYKLNIDSVGSGSEAIAKVKSGKIYDIIFMDHMMPIMDGIETAKILRGMGYTHSIVALTANVLAGQAGKFLASGFDDFISKPINFRQLDTVLNRFIRDKQPPEILEIARREAKTHKVSLSEERAALSAITSNFIELFVRDVQRFLVLLEEFVKKSCPRDELRMYVITMHGLHSTLMNIRQESLSVIASELEQKGRDGDIEYIASQTPLFIKALISFIEEVTLLEKKRDNARVGDADEDKKFLCETLLVIKTACEEYDKSTAEEALSELKKVIWPQLVHELLGTISRYLLHSDFDEAADAVGQYLAGPFLLQAGR